MRKCTIQHYTRTKNNATHLNRYLSRFIWSYSCRDASMLFTLLLIMMLSRKMIKCVIFWSFLISLFSCLFLYPRFCYAKLIEKRFLIENSFSCNQNLRNTETIFFVFLKAGKSNKFQIIFAY
jgi:hypothetical protein